MTTPQLLPTFQRQYLSAVLAFPLRHVEVSITTAALGQILFEMEGLTKDTDGYWADVLLQCSTLPDDAGPSDVRWMIVVTRRSTASTSFSKDLPPYYL